MPNLESRPLTTSIKFDPGHNLEMRADLAAKTAEVENLVTGEMYSGGGGGDSDFSTAEVTAELAEGVVVVEMTAARIDAEDDALVTEVIFLPANLTQTFVLYKGKATVPIPEDYSVSIVSGNAAVEDYNIIITGDCTLRFSAVS